jgi:steroid delta-isomerase-like uncharacterized protein
MLSLPHILNRRNFLIAALAFAVRPAISEAKNNPTHDELDAIVRAWLDAYKNISQPEKMLGLLAEDIFFEDPTFRLRHTNRESMRKMIEEAAAGFTSVEIDPGLILVDSPWASLQPTLSGAIKQQSGPPRQIKVRGATFLMIENGKIKRWTDYYDFRTYREQLQGDSTTS